MFETTIPMGPKPEPRVRRSYAFNLFRRKEFPELYCAVPEDRTVPAFIAGEVWEFGGTISEAASDFRGFDGHDASVGARLNGFYLFQAWPKMRPAERDH